MGSHRTELFLSRRRLLRVESRFVGGHDFGVCGGPRCGGCRWIVAAVMLPRPRGEGNGRAKTREAKIIEIHTAEASSPRTGEPQKDVGSETVSCQVDSAAAVGGVSRSSEFAGRLEREAARAGLHRARELVVISDGA